jgi:predicted nucleic acid-binding Zn ribbon protein
MKGWVYTKMPVYTFRDVETNEVFDVNIRMSELDDYKKENPNHERYFDEAPMLVSGTGIRSDNGFNEVLTKISEAHPESPLADRHLSKSIKQAKTDRIIKEWRKKSGS